MTDDFDDLLGDLTSTEDSSEKAIMNDGLMALSRLPKMLIYRQNTGTAWQGKAVKAEPGTYIRVERGMKILRAARPINFGIPGGGDAVGSYDGHPLQVEFKYDDGQQSLDQKRFQLAWEKAGGIYIIARSAREAIQKLRKLTASR